MGHRRLGWTHQFAWFCLNMPPPQSRSGTAQFPPRRSWRCVEYVPPATVLLSSGFNGLGFDGTFRRLAQDPGWTSHPAVRVPAGWPAAGGLRRLSSSALAECNCLRCAFAVHGTLWCPGHSPAMLTVLAASISVYLRTAFNAGVWYVTFD
jgi:hypothetical protein